MKNKQPAYSLRLSEIADPAVREKLEMQYVAVETLKREAVVDSRNAQRAALQSQQTMIAVQLAELDFLIAAGDEFDPVTQEPVWQVRRSPKGEVIVECLMTMAEGQKIQRMQAEHMRQDIAQIPDEDGDDTSGMSGAFRD